MPSLADLYNRGYETELRRQQMNAEAADRAMRRQAMLSDMMARNLPVSAQDVDKIDNPDTPPRDLEPIASKLYNHPGGMEWFAKQRGDALQRRQARAGTELTGPQMTEQFNAAFPGQQAPTFTQNAPASTFNTGMGARSADLSRQNSATQQSLNRQSRDEALKERRRQFDATIGARLAESEARRNSAFWEGETKKRTFESGGYANPGAFIKDITPYFTSFITTDPNKPANPEQAADITSAANQMWNLLQDQVPWDEAELEALQAHPKIGTSSRGVFGIGAKRTPAAEAFTPPKPKKPPVAAQWNSPNPVEAKDVDAKDLDARVQKVVAYLEAHGKTVTPEDEAKIRAQLTPKKQERPVGSQ